MKQGQVLDNQLPIYLTTEEEEVIETAPADRVLNAAFSSLNEQLVPIRYKNRF